MKSPPPDHLVPYSWLEKAGVTEAELDNWTTKGIIVRVDIHGGASLVYFDGQKKPVKFREIADLIAKARDKCK